MLSVLMSAFLCFSTTMGNINAISEPIGGVHMKYQGQEQPFIHILH